MTSRTVVRGLSGAVLTFGVCAALCAGALLFSPSDASLQARAL